MQSTLCDICRQAFPWKRKRQFVTVAGQLFCDSRLLNSLPKMEKCLLLNEQVLLFHNSQFLLTVLSCLFLVYYSLIVKKVIELERQVTFARLQIISFLNFASVLWKSGNYFDCRGPHR